jgi:hypothetical protein
MKVGNFNVTFHRPRLQKEKFPGDKEATMNGRPVSGRPRQKNVLPVQVGPVTPYNQLSSIGAVNQAMNNLREAGTPHDVVIQTTAPIAQYVRDNGQLPDCLIVGDAHTSPAGLMAILAALYEYRNHAGPKTFSFERMPRTERAISQWLAARQNLLAHCIDNDVTIPFPGIANPERARLLTAGLLARQLGFAMHGFDGMKNDAVDLQDRETAMKASLANKIPAGKQVIFTGAAHVPALYEALSPHAGTLAITLTPRQIYPGETDLRDDFSFVLSHPQITVLKPSEPLRSGTLDAAQFIKRELYPPQLR